YREERSVKILTDYLQAHDFDVTTGVAGLKTAFVARYKKGTPGPNLGVIVEYDALRGTTRDFHGDQHSAQGPVGMAAALAVAEFLTSSKTPGTVTVYGTPAEELASPAAKTVMYNAGVFKGADVLVRSHSSTGTQAPGPGVPRAGARARDRRGTGRRPRHRDQGPHRVRLRIARRHLGGGPERRGLHVPEEARREQGRGRAGTPAPLRGDRHRRDPAPG